jgi:hypothetical protein
LSLLTLAILVILAPLIWAAVLHLAPGLEPLNRLLTVGRFAIASLVLLLVSSRTNSCQPGEDRCGRLHPGFC